MSRGITVDCIPAGVYSFMVGDIIVSCTSGGVAAGMSRDLRMACSPLWSPAMAAAIADAWLFCIPGGSPARKESAWLFMADAALSWLAAKQGAASSMDDRMIALMNVDVDTGFMRQRYGNMSSSAKTANSPVSLAAVPVVSGKRQVCQCGVWSMSMTSMLKHCRTAVSPSDGMRRRFSSSSPPIVEYVAGEYKSPRSKYERKS